jgi:hypothetical protein
VNSCRSDGIDGLGTDANSAAEKGSAGTVSVDNRDSSAANSCSRNGIARVKANWCVDAMPSNPSSFSSCGTSTSHIASAGGR